MKTITISETFTLTTIEFSTHQNICWFRVSNAIEQIHKSIDGAHLLKKIVTHQFCQALSLFYGTRRLITVVTKFSYSSPSTDR